MRWNDVIASSWSSLLRTKGRSALTMLGIVIGVMSVILMLSIGEGAQRYIMAQISTFGSDVIFAVNGPKSQEGQPSLFLKESLTIRDFKKIQLESWVSMITGVVYQNDTLSANGFDTNVQIVGTTPDEIRFSARKLVAGSFFDNSAVDGASRVAVLGYDIAEKSFGVREAVGKQIKISNVSYRVIGVMEKAGSQGFQNADKQLYVPVTAALDTYNKKYVTMIEVKSTIALSDAKDRLTVLLRERHNIDNPTNDLTKDDFHLTTQEDAIESASTITNILQILLVSIAAISLIVGGIGIMNIMYVAVTERTKEIGLRLAIGATRHDVLRQFITEAVILTTTGGAIGIAIGTIFSAILIAIISQFQSGWTFAFSPRGIALGFIVSAAIGLVFGYFPARRASELRPIEALRFE